MNLYLEGKQAVVTGGSHGIGEAVARKLALEGCRKIFIIARSKERLDRVQQSIGSTQCSTIKANLEDKFQRKQLLYQLRDIDILINNVGGGGRWGHEDPLKTPFETWEEVWDKNVGVAIDFMLSLVPGMIERRWGRVVSITSIHGTQIGGRPWFNAAKTAQSVIMSNMAQNKQYARNGVTFNSVAPGPLMIEDTGWDTLRRDNPAEFRKIVDATPMGRLGTAEDVANVVAFLCSDLAKHINGASIAVDGGESTCQKSLL